MKITEIIKRKYTLTVRRNKGTGGLRGLLEEALRILQLQQHADNPKVPALIVDVKFQYANSTVEEVLEADNDDV